MKRKQTMNAIKTALFTALSVLACSIAFASPQDAVNQIKANSAEVLKILNKENGSNAKAVRAEAEQYAIPYFDFELFTQRALPTIYADANDEQKKQLVEKVKSRLINKYSAAMFQYKTAQITVSNKTRLGKYKNVDFIFVSSRVLPTANASKNDEVKIDYFTYQSGGKYRVFDVQVSNLLWSKIEGDAIKDIVNKSGIDGFLNQ